MSKEESQDSGTRQGHKQKIEEKKLSLNKKKKKLSLSGNAQINKIM